MESAKKYLVESMLERVDESQFLLSYVDGKKHYITDIMTDFANQSKWISVETEKPEARKDVPHLSINVIGRDVVNSMECFFNYYQKRWYDANGNNVIIIEWQPFPTAP